MFSSGMHGSSRTIQLSKNMLHILIIPCNRVPLVLQRTGKPLKKKKKCLLPYSVTFHRIRWICLGGPCLFPAIADIGSSNNMLGKQINWLCLLRCVILFLVPGKIHHPHKLLGVGTNYKECTVPTGQSRSVVVVVLFVAETACYQVLCFYTTTFNFNGRGLGLSKL